MAKPMSDTTITILHWFEQHPKGSHSIPEIRAAFPNYDPKLITNCLRSLTRRESLRSTGTGQYALTRRANKPKTVKADEVSLSLQRAEPLPEGILEPLFPQDEVEPRWITDGREYARQKARAKIAQALKAYV